MMTADPRIRYPNNYDTCPDCGGPKAKHGFRCRACSPLIRGDNHYAWKGDQARDETKRERAQGLYPELGICERCSEAPAVDRHHIDGDTGNNDRSNLAFLCRACHMASDGRYENLKQFAPDPKPRKRKVASSKEWTELREQFQHACCVACGVGEPVSLHHIVPRSQGGDDVEENLVVLCGSGTTGCHGKLEAHAPGWERIAAHVRSYVMARESRLSYVLNKVGLERFAGRYPEPPWLALGDLAYYTHPDPLLQEETA